MTQMLVGSVIIGIALPVNIAIATFLLLRPAAALRFIAQQAERSGARSQGVLERMGRFPPYSWLLGGAPYDEFVARAKSYPEQFPRLLVPFRCLGAIDLLVATGIAATAMFLAFRA